MYWNCSVKASLRVDITFIRGVAQYLDHIGSEYRCGSIEEIEHVLIWLDLAGISDPAIRCRSEYLASIARGTGFAIVIDLTLLLLKS